MNYDPLTVDQHKELAEYRAAIGKLSRTNDDYLHARLQLTGMSVNKRYELLRALMATEDEFRAVVMAQRLMR